MPLLQRIPENIQRVGRFLVAGGTTTVVSFSALYVLTEYGHIWYLASSVIAFLIGFITGFLLQKFWTFRNRQLDRAHIQAMMHFSLSLANLLINTVSLYLLVEYAHLWYMAAQFIISSCLACVNFFIYKTHIFRDAEDDLL